MRSHLASRPGETPHSADAALAVLGERRRIALVVPSFPGAMQVARRCDALAIIPQSCLGNTFLPDHAADNGLQWFELPVPTPAFSVSAIWHPRLDRDPAQQWLRAEVLAICQTAYPRAPVPPPRQADSRAKRKQNAQNEQKA
nr:hypothetical protein [Bordetella hinzii]